MSYQQPLAMGPYGTGQPKAPGDPGTLDLPWYGIGFGDAIKRGFAKFGRFDGRASRGEYWWWCLFVFLLGLVPGLIGGILVGSSLQVDPQTGMPVYGPSYWAFQGFMALYGLVFGLPIAVRRLHDQNKSGWFYLLSLIPCAGTVIVLILLAQPSNPEGARFDRR